MQLILNGISEVTAVMAEVDRTPPAGNMERTDAASARLSAVRSEPTAEPASEPAAEPPSSPPDAQLSPPAASPLSYAVRFDGDTETVDLETVDLSHPPLNATAADHVCRLSTAHQSLTVFDRRCDICAARFRWIKSSGRWGPPQSIPGTPP